MSYIVQMLLLLDGEGGNGLLRSHDDLLLLGDGPWQWHWALVPSLNLWRRKVGGFVNRIKDILCILLGQMSLSLQG